MIIISIFMLLIRILTPFITDYSGSMLLIMALTITMMALLKKVINMTTMLITVMIRIIQKQSLMSVLCHLKAPGADIMLMMCIPIHTVKLP